MSTSKRRKKIDRNQLAFDFDRRLEAYEKAREEILEVCSHTPCSKSMESWEEACIEVAAAIKRAIRQGKTSREQVVDGINEYFGCSDKNKKLSIHMFNHYLSKPTEYPIPTFYIFAIQHVTGSLEPTKALAEAMDARIISGVEVRQMALGKLDETISETQRLKRELKGKNS